MNSDFSHLAKLEVSAESTGEYCIVEIEGEPILIVRPANESNPDYMNARLRMSGQSKGYRKAKKMVIDTKALIKLRAEDRELFPLHVIVGWVGIHDSNGEEVQFTKESCTEFIAALPGWIFDGLRGFALDPESFIEVIDSEEKAGN